MTQEDQISALRQALHITPLQAHVLLLLNRTTVPMSADAIIKCLPQLGTRERKKPSPVVVRVVVHALRKALGEGSINTIYGLGYSLNLSARAYIADIQKGTP